MNASTVVAADVKCHRFVIICLPRHNAVYHVLPFKPLSLTPIAYHRQPALRLNILYYIQLLYSDCHFFTFQQKQFFRTLLILLAETSATPIFLRLPSQLTRLKLPWSGIFSRLYRSSLTSVENIHWISSFLQPNRLRREGASLFHVGSRTSVWYISVCTTDKYCSTICRRHY